MTVRALSPPLQLARTCKQLREEANAIYFEENVFTFLKSAHKVKAVRTFERLAGLSASKITCINVADGQGAYISVRIVEDTVPGATFVKTYDAMGAELSSVHICLRTPTCGSSTTNAGLGRSAIMAVLEEYFRSSDRGKIKANEVQCTCCVCGGSYWVDAYTAMSRMMNIDHSKS